VYKTIAYSHIAKIKFFENKDVPAMSRIVTNSSNNTVVALTLQLLKAKRFGMFSLCLSIPAGSWDLLKS